MNFMFENPIAEMRGPQFLQFYSGGILAVFIWAGWRKWRADATRGRAIPEVPEELEPLEIAYLRGGAHEVSRLLILALIERGFLEHVRKDDKTDVIQWTPAPPPASGLDEGERLVQHWMRNGCAAGEILPGLSQDLERIGYFSNLKNDLEERGLLTPASELREVRGVALGGLLFLLLLGGYKLSIAISHGRTNIGFLIGLMGLSAVVLIVMSPSRRLTHLGRRYLERLQHAMGALKAEVPALASARGAPEFLLAVALFGIAPLGGTAYGFYPEMFKRAAVDSSGGCGAGCSSSSCGGSSGCGGSSCGGGGCGGCGGGGD